MPESCAARKRPARPQERDLRKRYPDMIAVIETGGKQYKVTEGDVIYEKSSIW